MLPCLLSYASSEIAVRSRSASAGPAAATNRHVTNRHGSPTAATSEYGLAAGNFVGRKRGGKLALAVRQHPLRSAVADHIRQQYIYQRAACIAATAGNDVGYQFDT